MGRNGREHAGRYHHLSALLALVATAVALASDLSAQDPHVQLDAYGEVRDEVFDYMRMPLSEEDRIYGNIDGGHVKEMLNEVVAISRRSRADGNRNWGRQAGTKYEVMTADLAESKFRALGMEVNRVPFPIAPQWMYRDWNVTAQGSGKTLSFPTVFPPRRSGAPPNPATTIPTPLDLEAVWVGLGTAADFAGEDVRGKAVVFQSINAPGAMGSSERWENVGPRAEEMGAALLIGIFGYSENLMVMERLGTGRLPGFWMGYEDGRELRDLIAEGPVRIAASMDVDIVEGLTSPSQYGTLPGMSDETIIVTAHMDGWFDAALDNASGMAVMMALAEHFARRPREERRRTMIFVATAGHHIGSPNSPYMRDQGMLENTALLLNCEHIAPAEFLRWGTEFRRTTGITPRRWWVHGSDQLLDLTLDAYRTFGVSIVGPMHEAMTGETGRISRDAPSIQLIRSPEHKHTDMDIPALVPSVGIEAVARAFAKIVDGVNELTLAEVRPPRQTTLR